LEKTQLNSIIDLLEDYVPSNTQITPQQKQQAQQLYSQYLQENTNGSIEEFRN
jgi:hypothetical protein